MNQIQNPAAPHEVINLETYPIADAKAPAFADLVSGLRGELDKQQYVVLPGFIQPAARKRAIAQIEGVLDQAHHISSDRNCYLQRSPDPSLPDDHPRNLFLPTSSRMLAADLLPPESPLRALYFWDNVRQLVAGIVGVDELYENEDLLQPVNALCYRDGDQSAWHFDSFNAFTMTLMLQAPEQGGRFQMVPDIRSDADPGHERIAGIMRGGREGVIEIGREEGALCIFRGSNSLHRVSPVRGDRLRIMGVFVYEDVPGVVGDPEVNETVYGRRTALAR